MERARVFLDNVEAGSQTEAEEKNEIEEPAAAMPFGKDEDEGHVRDGGRSFEKAPQAGVLDETQTWTAKKSVNGTDVVTKMDEEGEKAENDISGELDTDVSLGADQ